MHTLTIALMLRGIILCHVAFGYLCICDVVGFVVHLCCLQTFVVWYKHALLFQI